MWASHCGVSHLPILNPIFDCMYVKIRGGWSISYLRLCLFKEPPNYLATRQVNQVRDFPHPHPLFRQYLFK